MKNAIRSLKVLLVALSLAAAAPACVGSPEDATVPFPEESRPVDAEVSLEEARVIAQRSLEAFNEGRYEGFSERWGAALRGGVDAAAFTEFRAGVLREHGRFVSILDSRVTPGTTAGNVRFTFLCQFERRTLAYYLAFPLAGTEVVGVRLAAPAP